MLRANETATWSKQSGEVKIHALGCSAAKATRILVICDAAAVADLSERGYPVKRCACLRRAV